MPLAHDKLAVLYRLFAQQLAAGLTLAQALRAPSPAPAGDTRRLAALAEAGTGTDELFNVAGPWLPQRDRPFLRAAARAGRLPPILAKLSERHAQLAATRRRILFASLYPVGVFHFAALVLPFVRMLDFEQGLRGGVPEYLVGVAWILGPAWGAALLLGLALRRENLLAHALLDVLPAIGGHRRHRALADFSFALGNLLEAGAPIGRAWSEAGEIARAPRLRRAADRLAGEVERGLAPGANMASTGAFPAEFTARYQTGEATGSLEQTLFALAADHEERANSRLAAASVLYPALLFAAVVGMVAYIVIGFALNYANALNRLM